MGAVKWTSEVILFVLVIGLIIAFFWLTAPAKAASCGVEPVKPVPPVGCKDLRPVCLCSGDDCRWEWVCVR